MAESNRSTESRWRTSIPYLGYHHVLMIISLAAILLWCKFLPLSSAQAQTLTAEKATLVVGCTSYSLKDISLLSLSYKQDIITPSGNPLRLNHMVGDTFADLVRNDSPSRIRQVNVGFMAMCLKLHAGTWICSTGAEDMVNGLGGDARGEMKFGVQGENEGSSVPV